MHFLSGKELFSDSEEEDGKNGCAHSLCMAFFMHLFLTSDLSIKSAEAIVSCAFNAHFIKEVTRTQITGAAKNLLTKE